MLYRLHRSARDIEITGKQKLILYVSASARIELQKQFKIYKIHKTNHDAYLSAKHLSVVQSIKIC